MANLGLRKGKRQLQWSLDASFDLDIAMALPNIQSKDKEGPSTTRIGKKGTERKGKERTTLAGTRKSRKSDIKEHLKREMEKRKELPS